MNQASDEHPGKPGGGQDVPSDESLAVRSLHGDLAAFEVLARRYQDRLYSYAWRMVGDAHEAADLTQETLMRAFRSLGRFDPTLRWGPWVFGVAAHVCRDCLRRRGRRKEQRWEGLEQVTSGTTAAEEASATEERERVVKAVRRLPVKYREVIVLHYLEELPYDVVAASLGISAVAARRRALRAREMLRRYLGGGRG